MGFVGGVLIGGLGVIAWQRLARSTPTEVAVTQTAPAPTTAKATPVPREVLPTRPTAATPTLVVEPATPAVVPSVTVVGKTQVIEVDEPSGEYTLALPMQQGDQIVLKGKVGTLKIGSIEAGATLDAAQLEASTIVHTGKIDGGAKVNLNAPFGTITMGKIDGGARVSINGRFIVLPVGVSGTNTQVRATIGRAGSLKVASVQGTAVVEYAVLYSGWSPPDVAVGPVASGAAFRKVDDNK
jgi:hypothetical protein